MVTRKGVRSSRRPSKLTHIICAICGDEIRKVHSRQTTCTKKYCKKEYIKLINKVQTYKQKLLKEVKKSWKN